MELHMFSKLKELNQLKLIYFTNYGSSKADNAYYNPFLVLKRHS